MSFSPHPITKTPGSGRGLFLLALLTAGIFVLDWLTPADYAVWLLYAIPVLLTAGTERRRYTYRLALVGTILTVVSFFLPPRDAKFRPPSSIAWSASPCCGRWPFWW